MGLFGKKRKSVPLYDAVRTVLGSTDETTFDTGYFIVKGGNGRCAVSQKDGDGSVHAADDLFRSLTVDFPDRNVSVLLRCSRPVYSLAREIAPVWRSHATEYEYFSVRFETPFELARWICTPEIVDVTGWHVTISAKA